MMRQLLACLALITGLTAAGTPAHAAVDAAMGLEAQAQSAPCAEQRAERGAAQFAALAAEHSGARHSGRVVIAAAHADESAHILGVYLQADRARE